MIGSKGNNTIIWIIIALILGILLIYFAWSRGLIPVFGEASRAQCEGKLITACDKGDKDEVTNLWNTCKNAYKGDEKLQDKTNADTDEICSILIERSRGQQTQ
jgi:hypothetical protein